MRCERMPKSMATGGLCNACLLNGALDSVLQVLFRYVMATCLAGAGIGGDPGRRKDVLPYPCAICIRIFPAQSKRQMNSAIAVGEMVLVQLLHPLEVQLKRAA